MQDVTARAGADPGRSRREAEEALHAAEQTAPAGLSWELVDFHGGGEYELYGYRTFQDVRLVMAPEFDIATFGKDWDNFAYPRHDLDVSLFRVYEDGQPFRPEQALAWSRKGIASGEPTFVVGHPGRTNRQEPWARMDYRRRIENPLIVVTLARTLATLQAFAARGEQEAQRVSAELEATANFLKVHQEEARSLEDPLLRQSALAQEKRLRNLVDQAPAWKAQAGGSWDALARLLRQLEPMAKENQLLRSEDSLARGALLRALRLVRLLAVSPPGSGGAPPAEFLEPGLDRELEAALLASGLAEARAWLGEAHPLVRDLLGGRDPEAVARQAMEQTRIDDPAFVRDLFAGGRTELARSTDPLILMAEKLDPHSRDIEARCGALETRIQDHLDRLARARHAVGDRMECPEANFTLRLSYGSVQPYPAEGTLQPPFTTFGGLFDRADAWGPRAEGGSWALPARWVQRRQAVDPSVPLDFITTNDITGGSSGSPVGGPPRRAGGPGLRRQPPEHRRPVPLRPAPEPLHRPWTPRAILEALRKVYDADGLVEELTSRCRQEARVPQISP